MLVSVIIPTYNRARILRHAIDSVLAQTYADREIIVVDDGSTDNTVEVLRSYGSQIKWLKQANQGPSKARNAGLAIASGEIITFLDSDDQWLPTKLARQVSLLNAAGESVPCCLCNCTIKYNDGTRSTTFAVANLTPEIAEGLWTNPVEVLTTRCVIFNQAIAIRRHALVAAGQFDEDLPFYCEDHELSLRLAFVGPWAIIRDELVVCQDASPDSLGQQALRDEVRLRRDQLHVRKRILALITANPKYEKIKPLAMRELARAKRQAFAAELKEKAI